MTDALMSGDDMHDAIPLVAVSLEIMGKLALREMARLLLMATRFLDLKFDFTRSSSVFRALCMMDIVGCV